MPNIPTKWRRYLYGLSVPVIGVLQVLGIVNESLAPQLLALAYALFIGGLAFTNTHPDGESVIVEEDF